MCGAGVMAGRAGPPETQPPPVRAQWPVMDSKSAYARAWPVKEIEIPVAVEITPDAVVAEVGNLGERAGVVAQNPSLYIEIDPSIVVEIPPSRLLATWRRDLLKRIGGHARTGAAHQDQQGNSQSGAYHRHLTPQSRHSLGSNLPHFEMGASE
jgi:hypothetical protein